MLTFLRNNSSFISSQQENNNRTADSIEHLSQDDISFSYENFSPTNEINYDSYTDISTSNDLKKSIDNSSNYFQENYELNNLTEVKKFIQQNSNTAKKQEVNQKEKKKNFVSSAVDFSKNEIDAIQTNINNNSFWVLSISVFIIIHFIFLKLSYREYIWRLIKGSVIYAFSYQFFRNKNSFIRRIFIAFNLFFVLCFSFFIYLFFDFYDIQICSLSDYSLFGLILLVIFFLYILKYISFKILGIVFHIDNYLDEYLHHLMLINKTFGLIMFPFVLFIAYMTDSIAEFFLQAGIIIFIFYYIIRILRGFFMTLKLRVSFFYILLFFIILELIPIGIIYKIIAIYFQ